MQQEETAEQQPSQQDLKRKERDLRWRKWVRRVVWLASTLAIALVLFEAAYRFQIVDFYATELQSLNSGHDLVGEGPALLVMGDSFSATQESYVKTLRDSLQGYRIVNSAVPGTGVLQAEYMARRRFSHFKPRIFVYQVYVGNDLLDIRPPYNWETLSRTRNFYWRFTSDFRSMAYLNYKMGQAKSRNEMAQLDTMMKRRTRFIPEEYNAREKLWLQGEPSFIEHSVQLMDLRLQDYVYFQQKLMVLLSHCRTGDCEAYVVVIPHCAQVSDDYLHRMTQIGASFQYPLLMDAHDYPFYRELRQRIEAPNLHFVNVLPQLQQGEKTAPMYYFDDPHLTPAGQSVVGQALLDSIAKYSQ